MGLLVCILFIIIWLLMMGFAFLNEAKKKGKISGDIAGKATIDMLVPLLVGIGFIFLGVFFYGLASEEKQDCTEKVLAEYVGTDVYKKSDGDIQHTVKWQYNDGMRSFALSTDMYVENVVDNYVQGEKYTVYVNPARNKMYDPRVNKAFIAVSRGILIFGGMFFLAFFVDFLMKIFGYDGYVCTSLRR